jgi:hypothetical protein
MRSARIHQRAIRLNDLRKATEMERSLHCLAARLDVSPEALRGETVALQKQCADRGIATIEGKLAFVAAELDMPIDELRSAVEEAIGQC